MNLRQWQTECISQAYNQYCADQPHFLCLATPGAGKTLMASVLAKRLIDAGLIDIVVCFSPSVVVANDLEAELTLHTDARFDGKIGAKGCSMTYQAMLNLGDDFWDLISQYRTFVIFDEIHHCAGQSFEDANSWGQIVIERIQGKATYTLALTGTPWRSDSMPIALAKYSDTNGQIHCDYRYGLSQAVRDGICRLPQITIIDNNKIQVTQNDASEYYESFQDLLSRSRCDYQSLLENEALMIYLFDQANRKLDELRCSSPDAGGLVVTGSVAHAQKVRDFLKHEFRENPSIATYQQDNALEIINDFKRSDTKWIISVGMISEGTNIPRLQVCCHLTRIRTELYFRQVLGRILRANTPTVEKGFLYMPAESSLVEFAGRVAEDIPSSNIVNFDTSRFAPLSIDAGETPMASGAGDLAELAFGEPPLGEFDTAVNLMDNQSSSLANSYKSSIDIFGRFRDELLEFAF